MCPLVGSKPTLHPEIFQAARVGAYQKAGLLVLHHVCQDTELGLAPGPGTHDRPALDFVHHLDMPLQVTPVPELHTTGNTPILAKETQLRMPCSPNFLILCLSNALRLVLITRKVTLNQITRMTRAITREA